MKKIKNSIRTKFIILFSIMMAVILAIQFYFMNQTQQNMLQEFAHLSQSINKTTDKILIKEYAPEVSDSLQVVFERSLKLEEQEHKLIQLQEKVKYFKQDEDEALRKVMRWKSGQEPHELLEEIDIHIPPFIRDRDSFLIKAKAFPKDRQPSKVFSINVPDFSHPKEPRMLRYQYSTASAELALQNIYKRNLLITVMIFSLSLILIWYITRRFLQPIEHLKRSFEDVVSGDLNVKVQNGSSDEIGSLTRSFNTMVGELQKNKQKEKLLQRKERLASLGQLAAGVAHEIKNPLNAINLTIGHLNDKYIPQDSKPALKYIKTIQQEIQRLDKLVNNFLNYLRSEDLKKETVSVQQILQELIQLYDRELKAHKIELSTGLAEEFSIMADAERLKTALVNLLVNAIQAMPDGGKLKMSSDSLKKEIHITDSGQGIPQKDLDHVFDLFYTTKQNGSGLGLPTAYKIIREHGADLRIESKKGHGTTVVISWLDV